jgi:hypothetical protein
MMGLNTCENIYIKGRKYKNKYELNKRFLTVAAFIFG